MRYRMLLLSLVLLAGPALARQDAADAPPPSPRADLSAANEAIRAQDYAKASELLAAELEKAPEDATALLMHGEVLLALGKPAEARLPLEKCVELDPDRVRAHFQLANVLQAAGELAPAIEHFGREIELNDDEQVRIMAHLNRSILYEKSKQPEPAAEELEAALVIDPDQPRLYGDLATLYLRMGALDRAEEVLTRGFDEGGFASAHHYYNLGARYYKKGAYEDAVRVLAEALDLQDGFADAERSMGAALDQLGREAEAVKHLERYLELRPDAPEKEEIRKRIAAVNGRG